MSDTVFSLAPFIESDSNWFVAAVCRAIAERPGRQYNPVWIYGPSGCGKTMLLNALWHHFWWEERTTACYESGESLTEEMLRSMTAHSAHWEELESCSVLLVDNVEFLLGKSSAQKELAALILRKCQRGQQVVLVSNCPQSELSALHRILFSGAEMVLLANIHAGDTALHRKIAERFMTHNAFPITETALDYFVNVSKSVPEVLEALNAAFLMHRISQRKITLTWAKKHFRSLRR